MVLDRVAQLVDKIARDGAVAKILRIDPARLRDELGLSDAELEALRSADAFFETEKSILEGEPKHNAQLQRHSKAAARPGAAAGFTPPPVAPGLPLSIVAAGPLTASSDTGTLLPGPNTGLLTDSAGSASTSTITGVPSPPAPPPAPGSPQRPPAPWPGLPPTPPLGPAPLAPPPYPPAGPGIPGQPQAPRPNQPPCPPMLPWTCPPSFAPSVPPNVCPCVGCNAAILGMVASVSNTALTAIAAISAIAKSKTHS